MGVNDELLDRAIRHAAYLERLKAGEVRRILQLLQKHVIRDLEDKLTVRLARIASRGYDIGPHSTQRIRDLLQSTDAIIAQGMRRLNGELKTTLGELAQHEASHQLVLWTQTIPLTIAYNMPNITQLRAIATQRPFEGRLLNKWFGDLTRSTQQAVQRQLQIGLSSGETVPQITRRIRGASGVVGQTRRQAEAVTRTAINHTVTQAREIMYEENADILKGIQIVATLDLKTTPICQHEDGKIYPVGEGPRPPFHMNCRTMTVPVIKDFTELPGGKKLPEGTRASLDGQVPAKMTYQQWLKKQTKARQVEVLGKRRAELFRQGQYSIDRHVINGRPLTLAELQRLDQS